MYLMQRKLLDKVELHWLHLLLGNKEDKEVESPFEPLLRFSAHTLDQHAKNQANQKHLRLVDLQ